MGRPRDGEDLVRRRRVYFGRGSRDADGIMEGPAVHLSTLVFLKGEGFKMGGPESVLTSTKSGFGLAVMVRRLWKKYILQPPS
jgi:hypothetical protein